MRNSQGLSDGSVTVGSSGTPLARSCSLAVGLARPAHYQGLTATGTPGGSAALRGAVGDLPLYMAQEIDKGVARALAAYRLFYQTR